MLARIVETSQTVAATRSRKAKVAALAETLAEADPADLEVVTSYLGGSLLQRRTGVGWRGIGSPPPPADEPTLTVAEVHAAFEHLASLSGGGSQSARKSAVADLLARATGDEQGWLRGVITGNVRQGALDALVQEGLAAASGAPLKAVRRAAMLAGGTVPIARAAFEGEPALAAIGLEVGRPVLPMLASSAPDVTAAMAKAGGLVSIDTKLDGIRIQVHKSGDEVVIATRSLDVITDRLPEVVAIVRALPADRLVLDGEAIALTDDGRPRPFQETASRTAMDSGVQVTPYFFDLLHLDGTNLLDRPGTERWAALAELVPEQHRTPSTTTDDPDAATEFVERALALGHEGVVVKSVEAPYDAGRRGSAWVKVKPVHTLDLVVLAVEWGSGRREGWLSNIHLGARADEGSQQGDGFVMLGKTFKGMTDEMLAWQTERFTELAVSPQTIRDGYVVPLRPEQVVEIALDGIQRSSRYPGGIALRFARVVRYRDDKSPAEADTLATVKSMFAT
nr:ATP-dependent DNA ligase [Nocardioides agariphilus]